MSYLHGEPDAEDGTCCETPVTTTPDVAPAVTPAATVTTATTPTTGAPVVAVEVPGDTSSKGPAAVMTAADAPTTIFGLPPLVAAAIGLGLVLILRK